MHICCILLGWKKKCDTINNTTIWWHLTCNTRALQYKLQKRRVNVTGSPHLVTVHSYKCEEKNNFATKGLSLKAQEGMGSGYFGTATPHYIYPSHQVCRRNLLQIQFTKDFHLMGSRRQVFPAVGLTLWNIIPLKMRLAQILLTFQKLLKNVFFQ